MAGYLPFDDANLSTLYKKIFRADFSCPSWFSSSAKKLIKRILDPNPATHITISEVIENEWFSKGYHPPTFDEPDISIDNIQAIFDESMAPANLVVEKREEKPVTMNAFELIATSQGLNLGTLFEKQMGEVKRETRFTSKLPAKEIISKIEEAAKPLGFTVEKQQYKMKLRGEKTGRKGQLSIATEIFEVAPFLFVICSRSCLVNHAIFKFIVSHLCVALHSLLAFLRPLIHPGMLRCSTKITTIYNHGEVTGTICYSPSGSD